MFHDVAANSTTVGLSDMSRQIISMIMSKTKVTFSIWGMAGIGKTHLARDIYHHPLIVQHFDLRLWVSIGPIHKDMKNIFVDMLAQMERKPRDLFKEKEEHELRDHLLHKSFLNRSCLIVFDDVWNMSVLNEVANLLMLKYLALTHNGEVPSSISKLQRLQILILRRHHNIKLMQRESTNYLPKEIWDLQKLEYLRIMGSNLPDPSRGIELPQLSKRLYVNANSCTEGILRGTPALRKLGIEIELQPEGGSENSLRCLEHTGILIALVSLKCVVVNPQLSSQVVAPPNHLSNLPRSLKKLSLKGLGYPWKYMSAIGSLPRLKVLKLRCYAFRGAEWEIKDEEFLKLKYLLLEDIDVVHWTFEGYLPKLFNIIVRCCYKLKDIPNIPIIGMIEVDECNPSIVEFAQHIKDKSDPSLLPVVIDSSWSLL